MAKALTLGIDTAVCSLIAAAMLCTCASIFRSPLIMAPMAARSGPVVPGGKPEIHALRFVGWNTLAPAKQTTRSEGFSLSHRMREGRGEGFWGSRRSLDVERWTLDVERSGGYN